MIKRAAILLVVLATPCHAWNVSTSKDAMTDRTNVWAEVQSGGATLLVGCLNDHVEPRITFPRRIGYGEPGVFFRFDDGPLTPRQGWLSDDGTTLYIWHMDHAEATAKLRNGKRFRLQLGSRVFDFDLAQGGKAFPAISCKG